MAVSYEILKKDEQVCAYIKAGNDALRTIGYTDHSFPHLYHSALTAASLLTALGYPEETAELAKIAGLLHDVGNMINRTLHALSGANIARTILEKYRMPFADIGIVCSAIGNHDEETGKPVNTVAAALVLADKSDVRRSRVQETDMDKILADIHDRVNYAVKRSDIKVVNSEGESGENSGGESGANSGIESGVNSANVIQLSLEIDTHVCSVMDYFEIFLTRMLMCRRAAAFLGAEFDLIINDLKIM